MSPLDLDAPLWLTGGLTAIAWLTLWGVVALERREARQIEQRYTEEER